MTASQATKAACGASGRASPSTSIHRPRPAGAGRCRRCFRYPLLTGSRSPYLFLFSLLAFVLLTCSLILPRSDGFKALAAVLPSLVVPCGGWWRCFAHRSRIGLRMGIFDVRLQKPSCCGGSLSLKVSCEEFFDSCIEQMHGNVDKDVLLYSGSIALSAK